MKKEMKCINNIGWSDVVTVGKVYNIIDESNISLMLEKSNYDYEDVWCPKRLFDPSAWIKIETKIKCIANLFKEDGYNENFVDQLTIGKVYDSTEMNVSNDEDDCGYVIIDDNGHKKLLYKFLFDKNMFKLISDIRNETIDKLLN